MNTQVRKSTITFAPLSERLGQLWRRSQPLVWALMVLVVMGCAGGAAAPRPLDVGGTAPVNGDRGGTGVTPTLTPPSPTPTATPPSPTPTGGVREVAPTPKEVVQSPRIVFEQEDYDLGNLPVDQMFMLHFAYRNAGDAPLVLEGEPQVETVEGC